MRGAPAAVLMMLAALWTSDVAAFWEVSGIVEMVQSSRAVVKARVVGPAEKADGAIATLEVLEVLGGQCGKTVKVRVNREESEYALGEICFLCLVPDEAIPDEGEPADAYREYNIGYTKMAVRNGEVLLAKDMKIPEWVKRHLKDRKPETVAAVLKFVRGPVLTAKPSKAQFRCDDPLALEVTVTNPSSMEMTLPWGPAGDFSSTCRVMLWDGAGFRALDGWVWGGHRDYEDDPQPGKPQAKVLRPGEAFRENVSFRVGLSSFAMNPERVATCRLFYRAFEDLDFDDELRKTVWQGGAAGDCPIRLSCAYKRWAKELREPNKAFSLGLSLPPVVAPGQAIWATVRIEMPLRDYVGLCYGQYVGGGGERLLRPTGAQAKALARCFSVELDGRELGGKPPKASAEAVLAWLRGLHLDKVGCEFRMPLTAYFPLDRPGTYRMRFALPGEGGTSLSNVAQVRIPEPADP